MEYGWAGKVLFVDLDLGECEVKELDESLALGYLGGRGINARLLYDETSAGTRPLDPDYVLILSSGPLVGTEVPLCNRGVVTTKSPLSYYSMSLFGGSFAPELK